MIKRLLFILVLGASFANAQSIIPEEIKPPSWKFDNLESIKAIELPEFDLKSLQKEDEINDQDKSKPYRFGYEMYVDDNLFENGTMTQLPNGDKIWRISYISKGAYSLNFIFDSFKIPEGAKLYVYNLAKNDLLRPFTHHNNNPEEILGTWLVEGNTAIIEYHQPAHISGQAKLIVGSVVHGYRTAQMYQKGLNDSGACNHDVDCDITPSDDPFELNTVKDNIKSGAGMLVTGGNGFCSGTLINNTNNDGTPYFMTANHCGGGEGVWAFRFNWRSDNPSCGTFANSGNGSFNQTASGSILRARSSQSDMELVEITDASFFDDNPDLIFVGWNNSKTMTPTVNFGIHHPSGDIQKTCREDDGAYRNVREFNFNPNTQMWEIDQWELGVTEPGSSGSGLFNEYGDLIGVLSGGSAACAGTSNNGGFDYYGRFGVAWDFGGSSVSRLSDWLDPANINATVLGTFPAIYDTDARVYLDDLVEDCKGFELDIVLFNPGALDITSATIEYQIDSQTPTTVNWSGDIANSRSEVVANASFQNLSPGPHVFTVTVSDPNGNEDENNPNNTAVYTFVVPDEIETESVTFNLTTDNFPEETSWELVDSANTVIDSGDFDASQENETFEIPINLPVLDECYTFTIFDEFGDGICCGFGNGSYSLVDDEDNVIIEGGEFGSSESITFDAVSALSLNEFDSSDVLLYPNPAKNILYIDTKGQIQDFSFSIFNTLGQKVISGSSRETLTEVPMSSLQNGMYFITIDANGQTITQKLIKD